MQRFAAVFVVFICMALIGCGSNNSNASNINGTWNATLTSGGNTAVFSSEPLCTSMVTIR